MINLGTDTAPLSLQKDASVLSEAAQRRLKLRRATQEFEAIFVSQILKNMRSCSLNEEEGGFGKDVMMGMADEAVSERLAKSGALGIGDLLYRRLVNRIEGAADSGSSESHNAPVSKSQRTISQAPEALQQYKKEIAYAARATGLSPKLIEAVILRESSGDSNAVSPKGALGLMQLMPDTAAEVGVVNPRNPAENILGGAKYLRSLLDRFGDLRLALAAYNSGPAAVERFGGVPPYKETRSYVRDIVANLKEAK
jgi:soluble lytic murein transglycosylase-like protein